MKALRKSQLICLFAVAIALLVEHSLSAAPEAPKGAPQKIEFATFGGGCFWCMEALYERFNGVKAVVSGYAGGDKATADYVAQKGEGARIIPTTEGFNLLAWLGPGFGFLTAAGFVVLLLRRWKRRQPPQSRTPATVLATDDPYAARLEREMRDFE
jgi:hypothetical protein